MPKPHKLEIADREQSAAIVKLDQATQMLCEIRDARSAKHVMDLASAAALFARKAQLGRDAELYANGIKLDAERQLGRYLREQPKAKGGQPYQSTGTKTEPVDTPTLKELGISKKLSSEAQRLAEIPDDDFAKVKTGEVKPSRALRELKRSKLGDKVAALPKGKHRVIYADPPWSYGDERGGLESESSAAAAHYPTMKTSDICAMGVEELAADDAVLFMWATFPLLEDAIAVVRAWGFKYKTAIVWHKKRANLGNYHTASCELLIIATRGACTPESDKRPEQMQSIVRGKHSAKPEEFREMIDTLYPTGPRIELFRRGDAPKGWKVWGNEADVD